MAQRGRTSARRREATTHDIEAALEKVNQRLQAWRAQRASIVVDIQHVIERAGTMLRELEGVAPQRPRRPKAKRGGRPKGFQVSAATRAKLRAAWKRRRQARAARAKGGKPRSAAAE